MSSLAIVLEAPLCSREDIKSAIVVTLADLGGFFMPGFGRLLVPPEDQKGFTAIPSNLIAFAIGCGGDKKPIIPYSRSDSHENILAVCKHIRSSSDHYSGYETPAIQELLKIILYQDRERKAKIKESESHYFFPLTKEHWYGRGVLALCEAFEVSISEEQLNWRPPAKA